MPEFVVCKPNQPNTLNLKPSDVVPVFIASLSSIILPFDFR